MLNKILCMEERVLGFERHEREWEVIIDATAACHLVSKKDSDQLVSIKA